ncbi:MAG: phosphatase PAP2 family protein [Bacteroidetes bacterium]|nr:MAG: phosphatase PAP2 family protein [Bacteroidota bacterium]
MIEYLNTLDTNLFLSINGWHNSFFDGLMLFVSAKLSWLPLYIFLLYLIIRQFRWRSLLILGFIGLLILAADQLSVHAFKNTFQRLRPCHNEELKLLTHTVKNCGGQFGFVSSHATNSFALLVFISLLLKRFYKWLPPALLVWGTVIAYSRVYLGVHYPGDVLGGALLGAGIGWMLYFVYQQVELKIYPNVLKD